MKLFLHNCQKAEARKKERHIVYVFILLFLMFPFQRSWISYVGTYLNLKVVDVFTFRLQIFHCFIAAPSRKIFPRSQSTREFNTSTMAMFLHLVMLLRLQQTVTNMTMVEQ
jgi:hypothetical protein